MHATLRRLKTQPGAVHEVAALIETEYLPMLTEIDGFVSYTLLDLGEDEISSLGIFRSEHSAEVANEKAKAWTARRLGPLVASPLSTATGSVLLTVTGGS